MKVLAGIDVVVYAVNAGLAEPGRLSIREQSQAGANLERMLPFDFPNRAHHLVQFLFRGRAPAHHDAIGVSLQLHRTTRALDDGLVGEEFVAIDTRVRHARLRAIGAVFGAQPAFGIDQKVELDSTSVVAAANLIGGGHQSQQIFVPRAEDRQGLLAGQQILFQGFFRQGLPFRSFLRQWGWGRHGSSPIFSFLY